MKQSQLLKLQQKISPQQIQFIKLLQIPTANLDQRIKEEIEANPALEDLEDLYLSSSSASQEETNAKADEAGNETRKLDNAESSEREVNIDDYLASDQYDYKTRLPSSPDDDDDYEAPIVQMSSLYDMLSEQISLLNFDENERIIAEQIIGNIEEDGYLRRPVKQIVADMAFRQFISVSLETANNVLRKIQGLDPPGIGAQTLQECLILQLKRKHPTPETEYALRILNEHFEDLSKKHFSKIRSKLGISESVLKEVYELITRLNPKPGESQSVIKHEYIVPDFILTVEGGEIFIKLNIKNAPELRVSKNYLSMYKEYKDVEKASKDDKIKETLEFLKTKIESAQWFIDALKQRQFTLLYTMESIASKQKDFFVSGGDDRKLKPMILKDIADEINMDISTVSRVANSKHVQTEFGIYPLKYFFTEGIETSEGIVSNREIKSVLEEIIENEDKQDPLSDDIITEMLTKKGYHIARRTVAKYREQLNIPVARLRKEV
ncbi:MAG: RNA polymerase factor sigma-54 [Bacteroidia bacterium]|nr:RNA polymerase factor sigma-54 [Bacteroidia bacterium]